LKTYLTFTLCRYDVGNAPHPPIIIDAYRSYLLTSLGLSPDSQASYSRPTIVLVNRRDSAREIVNMRDLAGAVRAASPTAEVVVVDMLGEGDHASVESQARLFNRATVVVLAHGAAAAWLLALPRNAHIVEVSMYNWTCVLAPTSTATCCYGTHRYFTLLDLFMRVPVTTC
jgi:capsular polysaccharide biosynthesis protein